MTLTKEKYQRLKQECLDYLGGVCVACGTTENLEVDHIDPATKLFDVLGNLEVSWSRRYAELDKCQLLCKPHHDIKTALQNKSLIHGEKTMWNKGCKCPECREGQKLRMREYYRRKSSGRGEMENAQD